MTDFEKYIENSDLLTLKFYRELFIELKELDLDPISIEYQVSYVKKKIPFLNDDKIKKIIKDMTDFFPKIDFVETFMILRFNPADFFKFVIDLSNFQTKIKELIEKRKDEEAKKGINEIKIYEMATKLKDVYDNAPKGYQMTFIHLFAIRHYEELSKLPIKKIVVLATGKDSLFVELGKGLKLKEFVTIKEGTSFDPYLK